MQATAEQPDKASSLHCKDVHCPVSEHSEVRDSHILDLLTAVIEATHLSMPTYGGCWVGSKRPGVSIQGWVKEVKPFRDSSIYWETCGDHQGDPLLAGCMTSIEKQGKTIIIQF